MGLTLDPWDDAAALIVLEHLDHSDWSEVLAARGLAPAAWDLHAEWRSMRGLGVVRIARWSGAPFAIVGVLNAGAAGVGQAALLARAHRAWLRPLVQLGAELGRQLPAFAEAQDLWRIECRSWSGHPTAERLLRHLGFCHEAALAGFHPRGQGVFHQWAWTRAGSET